MMGNKYGTGTDDIPGVGVVEWTVHVVESSSGASWSKVFGDARLTDGNELTPEQLRIVKDFLHVR